jgi:outer membrane protein assembly factor BamB
LHSRQISRQVLGTRERRGIARDFYASPIAADGRVYLASSRGVVTVVQAGDSFEVKARNELKESVMATPAIADDKIYVRTAKHLWAFGQK